LILSVAASCARSGGLSWQDVTPISAFRDVFFIDASPAGSPGRHLQDVDGTSWTNNTVTTLEG
jgi:hypothetical protein